MHLKICVSKHSLEFGSSGFQPAYVYGKPCREFIRNRIMGDSPQRSDGEQGWVPTAIGFSIGIVVARARGELNKKLDLIIRIAMTRWPWDAEKENQDVPLLSVVVQGD